jgi:LCP family protein required for cell wall assembly
MSRSANASLDTDALPHVGAPREDGCGVAPRAAAGRRWLTGAARVLAGLAAIAVLVGTGIGWDTYRRITDTVTKDIVTSQALVGRPASPGADQNILIMGLDSRLDQHGRPQPRDIYDALHAGDETVGGYNANVLIVLHVPGDGGPITAISIPRDDYVELAGCPTSDCMGKVKEAYGLAYEQAMDDATSERPNARSTTPDATSMADEQRGREAGRKAELDTVRKLLGIPIDHFVEVTLVAFFQIAQVVQPITVCLNADTADGFSGANFRRGVQQIDAAQAMAFVRQRRDLYDQLFTDMDRTRRQQAFIASLLTALRGGGALSSLTALHHLLDVARQNVAVDAGFDLSNVVEHASSFTGRPVSLFTLPITSFGQNPAGEDVNFIDPPTIRAIVHHLIDTRDSADTAAAQDVAPPVPAVLDVVNATTHAGLATTLLNDYASQGFTPGQATTAASPAATSTIDYGPGSREAAQTLARRFDLTATASDAVGANTVRLMIGSDFPADDYPSGSDSDSVPAAALGASPTGSSAITTPVAATATGSAAPEPTDLSKMSATDVPCVK